jgi:ABC-type multidrug transport system ATPase subunit
MSEKNPVTIQIMDLTKTYGKDKAIDSLNFQIRQGEILTLLGHSGAGKSSLLKMLTG